MHEISTWGMVAEVAGGITIWAILSYFWLTTQALMTLTIFLWVDVLFWLLDSYIVTKDTSSKKLVEWIARKFWRRSLPFIFIAALRWVWYENIETMATMVMSILIIFTTILGRLISGVHWFTDIIGGILISSFLLMLFHLVLNLNKKED